MNPYFHWAQAQRLALEGGRLLLLSNAAGVFASLILHKPPFVFLGGFLFSMAYLVTAYLTELHYGNGDPAGARRFHRPCYTLAAGAAASFCLGVVFWAVLGG